MVIYLYRDKRQKQCLALAHPGTIHTTEKWKIMGIDPSPEMIKQAIQKFKNFENVKSIWDG